MSDEVRTIAGSADPIPVIVTVGGVDQTSGFMVKLVPFETGAEAVDLSESSTGWTAAPPSAAGYPLGYYCVYSAVGSGSDRIVDHAGHVRIVQR